VRRSHSSFFISPAKIRKQIGKPIIALHFLKDANSRAAIAAESQESAMEFFFQAVRSQPGNWQNLVPSNFV
jgi:hypothetical protein